MRIGIRMSVLVKGLGALVKDHPESLRVKGENLRTIFPTASGGAEKQRLTTLVAVLLGGKGHAAQSFPEPILENTRLSGVYLPEFSKIVNFQREQKSSLICDRFTPLENNMISNMGTGNISRGRVPLSPTPLSEL